MELTTRKGNDVYVPAGGYRALEAKLTARRRELEEIPVAVFYAFDASTRLLPFVIYDRYIFPAGARAIAAAVHQAGFARTRAVFQLWNKNFRPSHARLDGRPIEVLLVSSMQMHSSEAMKAIDDAWTIGADRPLIIAGGPKAYYEPYHYWEHAAPDDPVAPDVVVTGEAYVLLDLLNVIVEHRGPRDSMRVAFERARHSGALNEVPGLVYLDPESTLHEPRLIDTGLQRLVQNLDEMPDEVVGLRLMEPPHRGAGFSSAPIGDSSVAKYAKIVSLNLTSGCKFNCCYCPIPAMTQRTWRFRTPEGIARQFRTTYEAFGTRYYFGTDDNFFNRRETSQEIFEAIAAERVAGGARLGNKIRWGTEATQFDTYKNRDLLPLARSAGMTAIWFGIEDLTAELINKGQKPEVAAELFKILHTNKIMPMAMIMYHEGQPFYTRDSLYGLYNQLRFLREAGAISMQVTVHYPAVGTREYEETYFSGKVLDSLGGTKVPDSTIDGNHVVVAGADAMWKRQLKLMLAYGSFYNPLNLLRGLKRDGSPLRAKRVMYQAIGFWGLLWTVWHVLPYLVRLIFQRADFHRAPPLQSSIAVTQARGSFSRLPEGVKADELVQLEVVTRQAA
ncbi:MAG TPA: radical SAM protein [Pirellulales bacterium]|jgi:radical SAM superfamily enzyme YgiQ (UPF0313 family)|nr:radical SAM protein [Pirellulales bacterium]